MIYRYGQYTFYMPRTLCTGLQPRLNPTTLSHVDPRVYHSICYSVFPLEFHFKICSLLFLHPILYNPSCLAVVRSAGRLSPSNRYPDSQVNRMSLVKLKGAAIPSECFLHPVSIPLSPRTLVRRQRKELQRCYCMCSLTVVDMGGR